MAGPDTPPLSESRLLTIEDVGSQTRIIAKETIILAASVFGVPGNSSWEAYYMG